LRIHGAATSQAAKTQARGPADIAESLLTPSKIRLHPAKLRLEPLFGCR
jgi:hypothetical protein